MKNQLKRTLLSASIACFLSVPAIAFESKDSEAKWDVKKPQGEMQAITINTDESTWSNLDVHPNGKTIIFDMLGDIYTLLK